MKAIRVATIAVAGMYQTSLVSYFINRDLFPTLMRVSSVTTLKNTLESSMLMRQSVYKRVTP